MGSVERRGHLAQLVGTEVEVRGLRGGIHGFPRRDPAHHLRQPFVGEFEGVVAQPVHPRDEPIRHDQREQEGGHRGERDQRAAEQRAAGVAFTLVSGAGVRVAALVFPQFLQGEADIFRRVLPGGQTDRQPRFPVTA